MQMEGVEVSESNRVSRVGMAYCNDGSCNVQESENVGNDLLDDLDSYLEDINDRLTISRMVSDSVIKGIVNAVSQEAAEEVAAKELEVVKLKEALCHHSFDCGASLFSRKQGHQKFVEPNHFGETMSFLSREAKEQLESLGKYIENQKVTEYSYINSPDKTRAFYSLKATLETMCHQVDAIEYVQDWKPELEICREVEAMVFSTTLRSMQDDYERSLLDVNGVMCLIDKFKEVKSIHDQLCSIQKLLDIPEHKHLTLHGSQEIDHFHHKVLNGHDLPSSSLWDVKGRHEEAKVGIPEDFETSPLKHLNAKELYGYFRNEINKMKRDHESTVTQMTEEYFQLKRQNLRDKELLKESGIVAPFKKDKDFEMLRKNLSEVILKLDDILVNNEKLSEFCNHSKSRLDVLLSENRQFRDLLSNQKLKLNSLNLQASHATKKLSQCSVVEENLRRLVGHLESSLEDTHMEASIVEEVCKCILRDVALQVNSDHEDSDMENLIMQEVIRFIYDGAVHDANSTVKSDYDDTLDFESTMSQQICEIVLWEMLRDLSMEFTALKKKSLNEHERLAFLESRALEIEKELQLEVEENRKLKHQVSVLENLIETKNKSFLEATVALEGTQHQLELAKEELSKLAISRTELESLLSERDKEVVLLKDQLTQLQKQVGILNEKLELSDNNLRKAVEEKVMFSSALEQEQNNLALVKTKDREHMKQMESVGCVLQCLSKSIGDFERTAAEKLRWHNVRLDNSAFQLHSLIPKINNLRRTKLLYKERLEKRCSDLQKAEAEVDVLGDEVDALLSLLEKIYVALDHYSPILQHYPGIIEILKLIKRELTGEPVKAV